MKRKPPGELEEVYRAVASKRGKLSNILRVHSLNPRSLRNHVDLYMTVMFASHGFGGPSVRCNFVNRIALGLGVERSLEESR